MKRNPLINTDEIAKAINLTQWYSKSVIKAVASILKLNKVNEVYDTYAHLQSEAFLNNVIEAAGISYEFNQQWQGRIPETGSFIIVVNHPLGALEGVILLKHLSVFRPDIKILGNYLMTRIKPISDFVIPINPLKTDQFSFNGLKYAISHVRDGGALIVFPAGQVSSWQQKEQSITDPEWKESVIRLIKKLRVPVIPIYFDASNSKLFYLVSRIHPKLRLAWIPREFFNKKGKLIKVHVGHSIDVAEQDQFESIELYRNYLRESTYILSYFTNSNLKFLPEKKLDPKELVVFKRIISIANN